MTRLLLAIGILFGALEARAQVYREYGAAGVINFTLWEDDGTDVKADVAATTCKIIKDEGASANSTNNHAQEGEGLYSLALTSTELTAKRVSVICNGAGHLARHIAIETFGDASAQHVDTAVTVGAIAEGAITATSIASNAITADKIAADAITSSELAQSAADKAWSSTTRTLSSAQTFDLVGNIAGNLSGSVGSVSSVGACALGTDAISEASISTAGGNKLADMILRRQTANVEASSFGDEINRKSLYGAVAQQQHRVAIVGDTITNYRSDGATSLGGRTITSSAAAAPITGIGN